MDFQQEVLDLFDQQLMDWELARNNYEALSRVRVKNFLFDGFNIEVQFNPERIRSTTAPVQIPADTVRPDCFLCESNLPAEQKQIRWKDSWLILCNPYPVFSKHLTIASGKHIPQALFPSLDDFLSLAEVLPGFVVFYNGANCGASAPMHLHFQAGIKSEFPLYSDYNSVRERYGGIISAENNCELIRIADGIRRFYAIESSDKASVLRFFTDKYAGTEPDINVLSWVDRGKWIVCVFERKAHRPSCYYEPEETRLLVSPASVEMAGKVILPELSGFERIVQSDLKKIFAEVINRDS